MDDELTKNSKSDLKDMDNLEYTMSFCKGYKISVKKPLIPLKIVLFCYYGAESFLTPFITVYFKQRGVTLTELSTSYFVGPIFQVGGTLLSGIVADKIGRSKPVLVANLVLTIAMVACILSVPRPKHTDCEDRTLNIECDSLLQLSNATNSNCGETLKGMNACNTNCLTNFTNTCRERNKMAKSSDISPLFLEYQANETIQITNICAFSNLSMCQCNLNDVNCNVECEVKSSEICYDENQRSILSKVAMMFYVCLMVVYSNSYRILDVTAMYLVTEHDSNYGKERFFSIAGNMIISPIAGYLVKITTTLEEEKNYATALYFFIALNIFALLVVYKLDVRIKPPGKQMMKKALILLKNPDVLTFALVVFVLGTCWTFTKKFLFWYLEEMQAPTILIGLIPAISALYGLPFLLTSDWWMRKIGTTNFFVLGLLGYIIYALGYSFLVNTWISLALEACNIVTYHLLWVAVVLRSHELAPEGLVATVIASAGSIHYHIGKTSGSLIAGVVMNKHGGPVAFRVIAGICFVCAICYSIYLYSRHVYLKRFTLSQKDKYEDRNFEPNAII